MPAPKTQQLRERADTFNARISKTVRGPLVLSMLLLVSCSQQMAKQPSVKPLEASTVFPDGRSARQPVAGTIPSSFARMDRRIAVKPTSDAGSNDLPFPLTIKVLERGRER